MELQLKTYTGKEIAKWFGIGYSTYNNNKTKYLTILSEYCEFKNHGRSGIEITKILDDEKLFYQKSSVYQQLKDDFDYYWEKDKVTSAAYIASKLYKEGKYNVAESTLYKYIRQIKNELYGKCILLYQPAQGTKGSSVKLWVKSTKEGYCFLTEEEQKEKARLISKLDPKYIEYLYQLVAEENDDKKRNKIIQEIKDLNQFGIEFRDVLFEFNKKYDCYLVQGTVIYCKNKTYFRDDCGNIYEVINGKIMGEKLKLSDDFFQDK